MIRIVRVDLPADVVSKLASKTDEIRDHPEAEQSARAHKIWHTAPVRIKLKNVLRQMAPGREYCMYCGDNEGTAIDHFEPIARNPLRTFDWLNHLLACSTCNSHHKREQFPVNSEGNPLLIDPTVDDPFDHLLLNLSIGEYLARTDKGAATIEVCSLNRALLAQGRADARHLIAGCLEKWWRAFQRQDDAGMTEWTRRVQSQPFADVCQAMLRQVELPGAAKVFSGRELRMLRASELRAALLT